MEIIKINNMNTIFYIKNGKKTNKINPKYMYILDKLNKAISYGSTIVRFDDLQKWVRNKKHCNLITKDRDRLVAVLNEFGFYYNCGFRSVSAESFYIELDLTKKQNQKAVKIFQDFYINL